MSNRQLMQSSRLTQRVVEYVNCIIKGQEYDTSKIACLVQVTCTNPFEIADLYHFVRVKDYTSILQIVRLRDNPLMSLQGLKGCYLNLKEWNFSSRINPETNQLEFEIVIKDFELMGGMGTIEQCENPVSLLEAPSVKNCLARLKKFYISERFNNDHPCNLEAIDYERFQHSEKVRKGVAAAPKMFESTGILNDPLLIWAPNDGNKSVSALSQRSDYDVLSINSQTQKAYGDLLKNKPSVQKPYHTLPAQNPWDLNFDDMKDEPLIKDHPEAGNEADIQPEEEKSDTLPTFGGKSSAVKDMFGLNEIETKKPEEAEKPAKRNFAALVEENKESAVPFQSSDFKKAKQQGWGVNHEKEQNDFTNFRQGRKVLENKKIGLDSLDLLDQSLDSNQFDKARNAMVNEQENSLQQAQSQRPPETRFGHPEIEDIPEDEIEESTQMISYSVKSRLQGTKRSGKELISKLIEIKSGETSEKSVTFGAHTANPTPKEEKKVLPIKPQIEQKPQQKREERQVTLQELYQREKKVIRPEITKKVPSEVQEIRNKDYINSFNAVTPKPSGQQIIQNKPIQQQQTQQQKYQHQQPQKQAPTTFPPHVGLQNVIDMTIKNKPKQEPRDKPITFDKDYLSSFTAATGVKKETPKKHLYVENPFKQSSQINLDDFKPVKPRSTHGQTSSSTVYEKSTEVKGKEANKYGKFTSDEINLMRKMYDNFVSTNKK